MSNSVQARADYIHAQNAVVRCVEEISTRQSHVATNVQGSPSIEAVAEQSRLDRAVLLEDQSLKATDPMGIVREQYAYWAEKPHHEIIGSIAALNELKAKLPHLIAHRDFTRDCMAKLLAA